MALHGLQRAAHVPSMDPDAHVRLPPDGLVPTPVVAARLCSDHKWRRATP